jgi:uncharacterized membrane protein YhaH (DUF805 family)
MLFNRNWHMRARTRSYERLPANLRPSGRFLTAEYWWMVLLAFAAGAVFFGLAIAIS